MSSYEVVVKVSRIGAVLLTIPAAPGAGPRSGGDAHVNSHPQRHVLAIEPLIVTYRPRRPWIVLFQSPAQGLKSTSGAAQDDINHKEAVTITAERLEHLDGQVAPDALVTQPSTKALDLLCRAGLIDGELAGRVVRGRVCALGRALHGADSLLIIVGDRQRLADRCVLGRSRRLLAPERAAASEEHDQKRQKRQTGHYLLSGFLPGQSFSKSARSASLRRFILASLRQDSR